MQLVFTKIYKPNMYWLYRINKTDAKTAEQCT